MRCVVGGMNHIAQHTDEAVRPRGAAGSVLSARPEYSPYLSRIREFPVLTESQERDLIRRWYDNHERAAYDALIGSHLRLVPKMAQKYAGYGVALADLIGEGNLGLL